MPVRLNSTGGGSVTLDVPATSGTFTINLPAQNGSIVAADGSGNVGIGTSVPGARFQVVGSTTVAGYTNVAAAFGSAVTSELYVGSLNGNAPFIASGGANPLLFQTNGAERMRIDGSGNVGIGTSSPRARSHVSGGSGAPSLSADTNNIALTTSATSVELAEGAYPGSPFAYWMQVKQTTNVGAAWPLVLQPIGGDVGIGTSSPAVRLDLGSIVHGSPSTGLTMSMWNARFGLGVSAGQLNYIAGTDTANSHVFHTNGSERARITSGGGFLLNTSDEFGRLTVRWDNSVQQGLTLYAATGTFNGSPVVFYNSSGGVSGFIGQTASSVSYSTGSDYRLKENVVPLTGAAARVQALKPSRFNFIADPDRTVDGFIAHEAAEVVPEAVHGEKDAVNEDGSIKPQGIDQAKLVPLLTAALQEALSRIETLEARLAAVEAR